MAFEKINYVPGDVLTADQVNKMQDGIKTNEGNIESHINTSNNPHNVTKEQVGLGNVPNVVTDDQTPTFDTASTLENITSGEKLSSIFGKIAKAIADLISHIGNKSNPHSVTATQVGARPDTWTPTAAQVGAVPTSRTVNGKALSANITLSASDVGAAASSHGTHVSYGTSAKALGTSSAGSASTVSRSDHVHALPALTSCTGTLSIAKGGTGKTTAAAALEALGGASITSLWTNTSPTSQFNAQVISKSLSGYDAVLIFARTHTNSGIYTGTNSSFLIHVGDDGLLFDAGETGSYLVTRKVVVYTNKIEFTSAKYPSAYAATNLVEGNKNLVPTAIYGVKW